MTKCPSCGHHSSPNPKPRKCLSCGLYFNHKCKGHVFVGVKRRAWLTVGEIGKK